MPKVLSFSRIGREPLSETSRPAEENVLFPRMAYAPEICRWHASGKEFLAIARNDHRLTRLSDTIIFAGETDTPPNGESRYDYDSLQVRSLRLSTRLHVISYRVLFRRRYSRTSERAYDRSPS